MMQQHVRPTTRVHKCDLVRTILGVAVVVIVLASRNDCVWADTNNWVGTSGSWFTSANWSLGALPSSSDDAFVANTNTANAIVQGTTTATAGNLFINNGGVEVGNINAGALTVNGEISVGTMGTTGTLTLNIGTISANTISIGANGIYSDTSSGTIILTGSNATINVVSGAKIVVNSQVTGTSGLIKGSLGTLTLAGNNTYSGGTTVSLGTLQVGNGGTTGSLGSGDVIDNAALVFDRSDSIVVSNTISGSGSLTQAGAGTLTLVGTNTYSGPTLITSGTLQVGDGGTLGTLGSGGISNNSVLVFDHTDDILVTNQISGTGSLTQAGTGTLTVTNVNTYSGGTWVENGGTLAVQDSHALGNGGLNLIDGTLKLSETTIYVGGSYTQGADGTLEITIGGTNTTSGSTNSYGQLNIAGTASLGGTVSVVQANGYLPEHNDQFVLVTASNGVTGTFSTLTNDFTYSSLLSPKLVYAADDVTLKWTQLSFVPYALTRNQRAVAQNLDAVSSSTISSAVALVDYLDNLSDPSNSLPVAFN